MSDEPLPFFRLVDPDTMEIEGLTREPMPKPVWYGLMYKGKLLRVKKSSLAEPPTPMFIVPKYPDDPDRGVFELTTDESYEVWRASEETAYNIGNSHPGMWHPKHAPFNRYAGKCTVVKLEDDDLDN